MTFHAFNIGGSVYRSSGIDPISQGHIARRLMPLLGALAPSIQKHLSGQPVMAGPTSIAAIVEQAMPLVEYLAHIDDATHDFILARTLCGVERERPGHAGWERVWNDKRAALCVDGISGADVIEIVVRVLLAELAPFFLSIIERLPSGPAVQPVPASMTRHLNG